MAIMIQIKKKIFGNIYGAFQSPITFKEFIKKHRRIQCRHQLVQDNGKSRFIDEKGNVMDTVFAISFYKLEEEKIVFSLCTQSRHLEQYLQDFPEGIYQQEALKALEACKDNRSNSRELKNYIKESAQKKYRQEAQDTLEKLYYDQAMRTHKKKNYEMYLRKFPQGNYAKKVMQRLESLVFDQSRTIIGYENYLKEFPQGEYKYEAKMKLDELYFQKTLHTTEKQPYESYLKKFPHGKYRTNVAKALDQLLYKKCQSMYEYQNYLVFFEKNLRRIVPDHRNFQNAQKKIRDICYRDTHTSSVYQESKPVAYKEEGIKDQVFSLGDLPVGANQDVLTPRIQIDNIPPFLIKKIKAQIIQNYKDMLHYHRLKKVSIHKEKLQEYEEEIELRRDNIDFLEERFLKKVKVQNPEVKEEEICFFLQQFKEEITPVLDFIYQDVESSFKLVSIQLNISLNQASYIFHDLQSLKVENKEVALAISKECIQQLSMVQPEYQLLYKIAEQIESAKNNSLEAQFKLTAVLLNYLGVYTGFDIEDKLNGICPGWGTHIKALF